MPVNGLEPVDYEIRRVQEGDLSEVANLDREAFSPILELESDMKSRLTKQIVLRLQPDAALRAMEEALVDLGAKITRHVQKGILAHRGNLSASPGEDITISVSPSTAEQSIVTITSVASVGSVDSSQNAANIYRLVQFLKKKSVLKSELPIGVVNPSRVLIKPAFDTTVAPTTYPKTLPVLPVRGLVVYPHTAIPLTIGQPRSIKLLDDILAGDQLLGLLSSRDPGKERPDPSDLYSIGTIARLQRLLRAPDGTVRILIQGLTRCQLLEFVAEEPYIQARLEPAPETIEKGNEIEALAQNARDLFIELAYQTPSMGEVLGDLIGPIASLEDPLETVYIIANFQRMDMSDSQKILSMDSTAEKLKKLILLLKSSLSKASRATDAKPGFSQSGAGMVSPDSFLKELEDIEDNRDNLRRLRAQLRNPIGIVPFVGAGLSMPFGFPSWSGFLLNQAKKAGIEKRIKRRLERGEYEEAAEDLFQARKYRAFHDAIDSAFGRHNLEGKELKGAVSLVPELASGPVITTNFDHVLEEVFEQAGLPFEQEIRGANAEMSSQALIQQKRFLIKIHGDAEDSTNRILTKSDYAKQYGSSDGSSIDFTLPLPRLLNQMLLGRALLFLGCSLNQDRTIEVLREVSQNNRSIAHYAIVEQPDSEKRFRERSQFLSDHNIRPIWYPHGRHDVVERLLAHLLGKVIPGESSLEDNDHKARTEEKQGSGTGTIGSGAPTREAIFTMDDAIARFQQQVVFPNESDEVVEYLTRQLELLDHGSNLPHKRHALRPQLEALINQIERFRNKRSSAASDEKDAILKELRQISKRLASLK